MKTQRKLKKRDAVRAGDDHALRGWSPEFVGKMRESRPSDMKETAKRCARGYTWADVRPECCRAECGTICAGEWKRLYGGGPNCTVGKSKVGKTRKAKKVKGALERLDKLAREVRKAGFTVHEGECIKQARKLPHSLKSKARGAKS